MCKVVTLAPRSIDGDEVVWSLLMECGKSELTTAKKGHPPKEHPCCTVPWMQIEDGKPFHCSYCGNICYPTDKAPGIVSSALDDVMERLGAYCFSKRHGLGAFHKECTDLLRRADNESDDKEDTAARDGTSSTREGGEPRHDSGEHHPRLREGKAARNETAYPKKARRFRWLPA